ncbi:MAG TPA: hypothetical protein VE733_20850 [Streptosporangiaceae bacterium]|jgi:uncharacterized protein HemY|nr:hypothetical protein [Streptosporangiaceae bacterium]
MSPFESLIFFAIGAVLLAFVLHWIVRTAISSGMKDFERWKRKRG